MSEIEQDHIVDAYTFELGKVEVASVVDRMVNRLMLVDGDLALRVSVGLGLPATLFAKPAAPDATATATAEESFAHATGGLAASPSLSMVTDDAYPIDGRVVQILANDGSDLAGIRALQAAIVASGGVAHVVATHKGNIVGPRRGDQLTVDKSFHTVCSAEADAIVVASGTSFADDPSVLTYIQTAFRHFKPIAAWGDGEQVLTTAGIASSQAGVVIAPKVNKMFAKSCIDAFSAHRHWDRAGTHPTRTITAEV